MFAKFLVVACLTTLVAAEIPSYFKICGRRNPDLNKCAWEATDQLRDKLKAGIPELDLPGLEPFEVEGMTLSDSDVLKASAKNIKISGLGDFETQYVDIDLSKGSIHTKTLFRNLTVDAEYDVNAKIVVPIVGHGPIHLEINDLVADLLYKFKLIKKNGVDHAFITSMTTKISIKDYHTIFTPTGNNDNTITVAVNTALQEARKEILATLMPNFEKIISDILITRGNQLFSKFSYDELFPDRE